MQKLTLDATVENVAKATEFVEEQMEAFGCSMKLQSQINIAVDELFVNIASYAYQDKTGQATVCVEKEGDPPEVTITFIDSGIPYNPLEQKEPDVHLNINDRKAGGLGIYIVKKMMDSMSYEYKDKHNVLTIKKKL